MYTYAGGGFPNQRSAAGGGPWHGSEVGLVFGTNGMVGRGADVEAQAEGGRRMREAWTGFAKDPEHGLDRLEWPRYDPKSTFWHDE
jgi:carboxylesterase type B